MSNQLKDEKLVELTALKKYLNSLNKGEKVGCISGSFDLMVGIHFEVFRLAAKECSVLIVLLNGDESIKSYKGPSRPFLSETERAYILSQSQYVDKILIFKELTPVEILKVIKPDVFFNSSEWGKNCVERNVVEENNGTLKHIVPKIPEAWSKSSTDVVNKIAKEIKSGVKKAVFLDRDGVINENREGYIYQWKKFRIIPGVVEAMKKIEKRGYELIIVSNQSGVDRGYYKMSDVEVLHKKLCNYLKERGVTIADILICPHLPEKNCSCRKPNTGMFEGAVKKHGLNLSKSWFVGDNISDVKTGLKLNLKTVYIGEDTKESAANKPSFVADNLLDAVTKYIE